jgi:transposase
VITSFTFVSRPHRDGWRLARHSSAEFVRFLEDVVASCPPDQPVHIILDNLSVHKSAPVREFLAEHPHVEFHFTPTYSSWLNRVEIWFSKLQREVIDGRHFHIGRRSAPQGYALHPVVRKVGKAIRWNYSNVRQPHSRLIKILPEQPTRALTLHRSTPSGRSGF